MSDMGNKYLEILEVFSNYKRPVCTVKNVENGKIMERMFVTQKTSVLLMQLMSVNWFMAFIIFYIFYFIDTVLL